MSTKLKAGTSSSGFVADVDSTGILELQTGSTPTTAVTVDASQNVGVGITPFAMSGLGSSSKAIDIIGGPQILGYNNSTYYTSNAYYNGGWKYKASAPAVAMFAESSGEFSFYNATSGTAGNSLSWTERFRIDVSGNVTLQDTSLINGRSKMYSNGSGGYGGLTIQTYNGGWADKVAIAGNGKTTFTPQGNQAGIEIKNSSGTGGYFAEIDFLNNAGSSVIGQIVRVNDSSVSYNTTSDYRLKENVTPLENALDKVAQLKPVRYTWKSDKTAGQGFIAHELQEVVPEAVTGDKDAVNEDGSIKPQGIDTSFLVATLTAAIQELKAQVDAQALEIAALKGTA